MFNIFQLHEWIYLHDKNQYFKLAYIFVIESVHNFKTSLVTIQAYNAEKK